MKKNLAGLEVESAGKVKQNQKKWQKSGSKENYLETPDKSAF